MKLVEVIAARVEMDRNSAISALVSAPVDRPEIVVLVFAHSESPAPVAVRCDPLCTAGRRRRQQQIKDSDPLAGFAVVADRYNLTIACHVHLLHNNANTEDIGGKGSAR